MQKLLKGILIFTVLILSVNVAGQPAKADSIDLEPSIIILADRQAIGNAELGEDYFKSIMGLISTLHDGGMLTYINLDDTKNTIGPLSINDPGFADFKDSIYKNLSMSPVSQNYEPNEAINDVYNYLNNLRAPVGSTVFLLAGGTSEVDPSKVIDHFKTMAPRFQEQGWIITGLTLPGTSSEITEFVTGISQVSGSSTIQLSTPDTFKSLAALIINNKAQVTLDELGRDELSSTDVFTTYVDIMPGTNETMVFFFKEGAYGSLRLRNPSGFEASAGDRSQSEVIDTPHVVVWKLKDPTPGQWQVDVRGVKGLVSAWTYSINKYTVSLQPLNTVPLGQPSTLVALVTDNEGTVSLPGATIVAELTTPDGATIMHELNDNGTAGDAVEGDGYYSGTIPALNAEGTYKIELGLSWPGFNHRISSRSTFNALVFPAIQVAEVKTDGLEPGKRSLIATLKILIDGHPYAVPTNMVSSSVISNEGNSGVIEIKPTELVNAGEAWQYEVFLTPSTESLHTVSFGLNALYSGKDFSFNTNAIIISSVLPIVPVQAITRAMPTASPPVKTQAQTPVVIASSGFNWWTLSIPITLVLILMSWGIYWISRTRPYGYLFNDENHMVADFANLKRRTLTKLFARNSVHGKELRVPGLEGVTFSFRGKSITLNTKHVTPTIRVNDQPIIDSTSIGDKNWIGTHGRLFTFLLAPIMQAEPGFSSGDD